MGWLKDFIFWKRDYNRHQAEMWGLKRKGHDIGMLPGGHLIHYSVCECHTHTKLPQSGKENK